MKLSAQEFKNFSNVQDVFSFAKRKNYIFKNARNEVKIAELGSKTAVANLFNPRIPTTIQTLNNVKQQISFLPGQIFGLPEGTYKEVAIGQQYISTLSIQPQFDLINRSNYAQIKTAKINQQLIENQNKIEDQNFPPP